MEGFWTKVKTQAAQNLKWMQHCRVEVLIWKHREVHFKIKKNNKEDIISFFYIYKEIHSCSWPYIGLRVISLFAICIFVYLTPASFFSGIYD